LGLSALLGFSGCDKGGAGAAAPAEQHPLLGTAAPEFEIPSQTGGAPLSPQSQAGKVVIIDFWATWCAPCRESFPFYQSLVEQHGGEVVVLAVSVDEEPAKIPDFAKETGVTFPLGWDEGQVVAKLYNPEKMPTSYLVDKNGVVSHVHAGFADGDPAEIARHVDALTK
jgi:cytochrome c biogenesis protein CcmG/thiol:disulfide interchange protein DsbE